MHAFVILILVTTAEYFLIHLCFKVHFLIMQSFILL